MSEAIYDARPRRPHGDAASGAGLPEHRSLLHGAHAGAIHALPHRRTHTDVAQLIAPTKTQACMLFARGLLHHFDGDPASAVDDYTRALIWMPDPAALYEMRGD